MKLSLSGRILQGAEPMTTTQFIHLARDTGYDLVELRSNQVPVDGSDAELAALRQVLDTAGIGVSMIVAGGIGEVTDWVRVARALGAINLRANGNVEELAAAAESLPDDLRLVCQMHSGSVFENVSLAAESLARIPSDRFGVMPEPANLLFAGEIWSPDLLLPLSGRIYGCNAQSIALDPESDSSVPMNDGSTVPYSRLDWPANTVLDFPGFVAALQAARYDDFINFIDPFHPDMSVQDLAASTAAYARQCLG
ncbi:MAG: sugar phosphate isomerase/epimerase [Gemmatimonadetes bacterium]|jgi:sugar phosphate isomerase/epimerase|nr:sugar phosphate isomerase/epimerase [Gemmatimonadota bacterium]MBT6145287.1 sugar phosphate isomerase/epimerase [Gemmatimonadota bacterium]MBT7862154.1 sugar phosphate isomerase/epimerase [Gemmatimonadota bacterium]